MTNIERDVHKRLSNGLFGTRIDVFPIQVDMKIAYGQIEKTPLPTLAPYEVFAELYNAGPAFFRAMFGNEPHSTLTQYWDTLQDCLNPTMNMLRP